jgi:hypothetical protein
MPNLCPLIASREWFKENVTLRFLLIVTLEKDQEMSFERVAAISLTEISGLAIRTTTMTRLAGSDLVAGTAEMRRKGSDTSSQFFRLSKQ